VGAGVEGITRRAVTAGRHRVSYLTAGPDEGEAVVLLHGLASDATTWDRAIGLLAAQGLRVVAVDLIGHGWSDKPASGYLLPDFADSLAAFFAAARIPQATVCGHSLGGAVAVHFAYHHPQLVSRLVLVSAGGLGREVHPVLRAASLPGAQPLLAAAVAAPLRRVYRHPGLHRLLRLTPENLVNLRRAGHTLDSREGRTAFFAALRGVIEPAGQRGSFIEMRYLAEHLPTLLIWTEGDGVIPVAHAYAAHDHLPASRLVVFPGTGHEPHRRDAQRFAAEVGDFVRSS
jgi:pimeloyl-ACP methyl ester carboxylesterase